MVNYKCFIICTRDTAAFCIPQYPCTDYNAFNGILYAGVPVDAGALLFFRVTQQKYNVLWLKKVQRGIRDLVKNKKWIILNVLAVFSGISLLLQQFFLSGNNMSIWEAAWFIMTIALCFSYVSYGFWVFYANPKVRYEIKPKLLPVVSFVLVAVELALTTACILLDKRLIFIIIFAATFVTENVFRILYTFKAIKGKAKNSEDMDYSQFAAEEFVCTSDEEVDIGFSVGVSILLAFLPLLIVISMGFENLRSLVISYHIILVIAILLGFLCLNKLFRTTEKYQTERTKLKILSGLLIFNQLAVTAFVWIIFCLGKDYFRAFAVATAIISTVQALVFATVPLSKLDMKMKYYLQQKNKNELQSKRSNIKENDDETNER